METLFCLCRLDPSYLKLTPRMISDTVHICNSLNPSLLWETCKLNIKSVSIYTYSTCLSQQSQHYDHSLIKGMASLERQFTQNLSSVYSVHMNHGRAAFKALYDQKLKGTSIIVHSRAPWTEQGEKYANYLFNLKKRNRMSSYINELVLEDSMATYNLHVMVKEAKTFYQNLYTRDKNASSSKLFLQCLT